MYEKEEAYYEGMNEDVQIEEILEQREETHGEFRTTAITIQLFKSDIRLARNWSTLSPMHKEALEMIVHKIGRILSGNPNHRDSWTDISGYATLAERECK